MKRTGAGIAALPVGGADSAPPTEILHQLGTLLASYGVGNDTVLAHITPEEADLLRRRGGAGTPNKFTGLPQFLDMGGNENSGHGVSGNQDSGYGGGGGSASDSAGAGGMRGSPGGENAAHGISGNQEAGYGSGAGFGSSGTFSGSGFVDLSPQTVTSLVEAPNFSPQPTGVPGLTVNPVTGVMYDAAFNQVGTMVNGMPNFTDLSAMSKAIGTGLGTMAGFVSPQLGAMANLAGLPSALPSPMKEGISALAQGVFGEESRKSMFGENYAERNANPAGVGAKSVSNPGVFGGVGERSPYDGSTDHGRDRLPKAEGSQYVGVTADAPRKKQPSYPDGWDEDRFLAEHPDAADAVRAGIYQSGFDLNRSWTAFAGAPFGVTVDSDHNRRAQALKAEFLRTGRGQMMRQTPREARGF